MRGTENRSKVLAFFSVPVEVIILCGAVAYDLLFGEPGKLCHPVIWTGKVVNRFVNQYQGKPVTRLDGAVLLLGTLAIIAGGGTIILYLGFSIHPPLGVISGIFLLKSTISLRLLFEEVRRVQEQVETNIELARNHLRSLVSRNRDNLTKGEMCSAAIESLYESLLDTWMSPLFYYVIGSQFGVLTGIGLTLSYKVVNTVDSMIGYPDKEIAELGFAGARADDVLNFLPAKLVAIAIGVAGVSWNALRISWRDARVPASPNSGWPMAAGSGFLKVQLRKPGSYILGREYELPLSVDIGKALRNAAFTAGLILLTGILVVCL